MTFTYTPATPDDITRVRWHIGDTVEATAAFSDEELLFAIAESQSWQKAVIWAIQTIIARLASEPDFRADWLSVNGQKGIASWRALLAEKRQLFGVPAVSARGQAVYRSDSNQTEPPDW